MQQVTETIQMEANLQEPISNSKFCLHLRKKKGNQNPAPMDIQGLPNERGRHRYSRRFDQRCSECPMGGRQPHDLWSQDTTVLLRVKSLGHAGLHLSSYSESESQGGGSEEDDVKQT